MATEVENKPVAAVVSEEKVEQPAAAAAATAAAAAPAAAAEKPAAATDAAAGGDDKKADEKPATGAAGEGGDGAAAGTGGGEGGEAATSSDAAAAPAKKEKEVKPTVHKANFEKDVVYLYQFTRTPMLPSISPFCLKVETWLRLAGLKYEVSVPPPWVCRGSLCQHVCHINQFPGHPSIRSLYPHGRGYDFKMKPPDTVSSIGASCSSFCSVTLYSLERARNAKKRQRHPTRKPKTPSRA